MQYASMRIRRRCNNSSAGREKSTTNFSIAVPRNMRYWETLATTFLDKPVNRAEAGETRGRRGERRFANCAAT